MSGQSQYKELLDKEYSEVLADENLRKRLIRYLNSQIFKIANLEFIFQEQSLSIILPPQAFKDLSLYHAGRPSKTKIHDFLETWKTLEFEFENEFSVDTIKKPSHTNLVMDITFYFFQLKEELGVQLCDMIVRNMGTYLKDLWSEIRYRFLDYGYNILKATYEYKRR